MMNVDSAKEAFDNLSREWIQSLDKIQTEEDTRFQIIDRILTKILGWEFSEISTEPSTGSGYIDYLIHHAGSNKFVLEAKKTSTLLVDSVKDGVSYFKLSGPALKSAQDGIKQARNYCIDAGVNFAILTNGIVWIAFLAIRTDGKNKDEGKAIVFHSLQSIAENFSIFYDLLSKEGILEKRYQILINKAEGLNVSHAEVLKTVIKKSEIILLKKSNLAEDLERIFSEFFTTMSADSDPDMLLQCFVETKESKEADSSLEKITNNLISQIKPISPKAGHQLQKEIEDAVGRQVGESVLIIGNKGAGKSTFIDRFFRQVLSRQLREKCLVIRIDMSRSPGVTSEFGQWLNQKLKDEIEKALYGNNTPEYSELQGIFYKEYERWKNGEHKFLYIKDKDEFKREFGNFLYSQINKNPYQYCINLLERAIMSRRQMPCIIFDNTDHFTQDFQEAVFQYSQGIFKSVFSFIICPITDRTIWQLSKSGPFQTYPAKTFYLPIPSTKEILEKRINYIKDRTSLEKRKSKEYFLKRGIKLKIKDLEAFASCLEEVFLSTDFISRTISWLTNHDIRRSLKLSEQVMTSPVISIDQLFGSYVANRPVSIKEEDISRALILGNYKFFNQENSDFILNLFQIDNNFITSPLSMLSILQMLKDRWIGGGDSLEDSYITIEEIEKYFEPMGIPASVTFHLIKKLLKYRLIDPYDPSYTLLDPSQRLAITFSGKIHQEMALNDPMYLGHMSLVSSLRSEQAYTIIRNTFQKTGYSEFERIRRIFAKYCQEQDHLFLTIPNDSIYDGQRYVRAEFDARWLASEERK